MFVTIILDTEYMGMGERHKWFLKNLSHAKRNGWFVITHEHLGKFFHTYAENCADRFYQEFEMERLNDMEYGGISKGFVPDRIFEEKEEELGSRTEFIMYLFKERYLALEQYLIMLIEEEQRNRCGDKVEGIFNCLDCFESIKYLGKHYGCPVMAYTFSAIRKVHGYQQTLYAVSMDGNLCSGEEGRRRYREFEREGRTQVIFSKRELLALFGKERNLPLLNLMDCEPEYEIGVCTSAWDVTHSFMKFKYTDDDIYYECRKAYPSEKIITRMHPMGYRDMGISREFSRDDPVAFLLSCRRVAGVQSQMLLKAILWNRTVYAKGDFLQFSFLCEKDIRSAKKADVRPLNYYIIGFLVPSGLMFDSEYWRWRIDKNPSEHKIYGRHFSYYLKNFELDSGMLFSNKESGRFAYLLRKRGCPEELVMDLLKEEVPKGINFDVLYSKLELGHGNTVLKSMQCVNRFADGKVTSRFLVNLVSIVEFLRFYPFADIGAKAKINGVWIDGQCILREKESSYFPKVNGYRVFSSRLQPGKHVINVEWEYKFA